MFTDPISDMLTRIRNAVHAKKQELVLPYSKFKHSLAKLLLEEGFINGVNEINGQAKLLQLNLKYDPSGNPVISGLERVSSPGQRIYLPVGRIPRTNGGFGVTIVSTSRGLVTDSKARKERLGGEVVCKVW
jgi:small subunit ribosomal protein S8